MTNGQSVQSKRKQRKHVYEGVLKTVKHNSGLFHSAAGMAHPILIANRARANVSPERTKKAIRAALDNDHLFRYEDRDGTVRYALAEPKRLRAIIAAENDRDDPDLELIERVVEAIPDGGINGNE